MNRSTIILGLIGLALAPPFVALSGDPSTAALGLLCLLILGFASAKAARAKMLSNRRARMKRPCRACWYELDGLPETPLTRCPECGQPSPSSP